MKFDDLATGYNEIMRLQSYSQALPGQTEHEMLRDVPGTNVTLKKCGDGYVLVSKAGRGIFVVWLVSDQMYIRIDNSFDKEMVTAYVNRLGSVIPKDYKVSVDKWVQNEIYWRLIELGESYEWDLKTKKQNTWFLCKYVTNSFPEVYHKFNILSLDTPLDETWEWLYKIRNFLWANRKNFKYHDTSRGYVLKVPDLYDPEHPPDLPDEIKGPPKPEEPSKDAGKGQE